MNILTLGKSVHDKKRRRVVRVNANELTDVDVTHISLVANAANRIPFRVLKSEDGEMGINLSGLFGTRQKGDNDEIAAPAVVGIVVQRADLDGMRKSIEDLGYVITEIIDIEGQDAVILKTADYDGDAVTLFKMSEHVGVLVENVTEEVKKQFMGFAESSSFDDNLKQAGFFPGLHLATEVLMETMVNIMLSQEGEEAPTESVEKALGEFSQHIQALVSAIPATAFKLEGIVPARKDEATDVVIEDVSTAEDASASADDATDADAEGGAADGGAEAATGDAPAETGVEKQVTKLADIVAKMATGITALADRFDGYAKATDEKLESIQKEAETRIKTAEEAVEEAERKLKGTVTVDPTDDLGDSGVRSMTTRKQGEAEGSVFESAIHFEGFETTPGGGRVETVD